METTILHFNARSIINKFDEIKAEILFYKPTIVRITETWLTILSTFHRRLHFLFDIRKDQDGGDLMILIEQQLIGRQLISGVTTNNAFNTVPSSLAEEQSKFS